MMTRRILAVLTILLTLTIAAKGAQININSAADLPYRANSGDTINLPGGVLNLPPSNQAIGVLNSTYYYSIVGGSGVNDVRVNFNGTTVNIDVGGGASSSHQCGIILRGDLNSTDNNSVIGPGAIIRNVGPGSDSGDENKCLIIAYDRNTLVQDMDFVTDGDNGIAVEGEVNGYNTRFINCTFTSNSNSFNDRQYFSSGGLKLSKPNQNYMAGPGQFQYVVEDCAVLNSPHFGLALYDSKALISRCSVSVDAQNVKYDTLPCFDGGDCGVGRSSANSYSIICNFSKPGSEIHDNVITSGRNHGGSRGIFIENSTTTAADPVRIYNNRLYLNAGPDGENQVGWLRGIRLRTLDNGYHLDHIYVYDNHIEGWVDDDPQTTAIGENAVMLQWGLGGPDAGYGNLRMERNTVICRSLTGNTTGIAAGYCVFEGEGITTVNAVIQNNHYYSSDYVVWPVDLNNAGSAHDLKFIGDTLSFLPPGDSGIMTNPVTWRVGNYLQDSWDIIGRDCVYLDGASDTNIVFHNSSTHEIALERTINVAAVGDNGLWVDGAQITVTDGYGRNVIFGTANGGVISGVVTYWYESNNNSDSTGFNDFTFAVSKDAASNSSAGTVMWDTKTVTVSLPGVNGTVTPGTDPLSNVYNFSAEVLALDYSGETDSVEVSFSSGSDTEPDSVIFCYSTSGYPDSASGNRRSFSYGTSTNYLERLILDVNDPDSLYFSYWTKKNGAPDQFSSRGQFAVYVVDLVAPARVDSLYAEPGPATGALDFIWEATGADGQTGTASYDSIRYSTSAITAGSWALASVLPGPPGPKPSGAFDTVTIAGLTPGDYYYVAIRAYDAENNPSPLATTSGFARGILVPGTTGDTIVFGNGSVTLLAATVPSYHTLHYEFELSADSNFSNPQPETDSIYGAFAEASYSGLDNAATYYWHCRAVADDASEASVWSGTRAFSISSGYINSAPPVPVAYYENGLKAFVELQPSLMVQQITDPDGDSVTYFFELYDATHTTLLASSAAITADSALVVWTVPDSLSDNTVYGWRARTFDGELYSAWSGYEDITISTLGSGKSATAERIISYPNPVHYSQTAEVTFNLPEDEDVDLLIQSISGETVLVKSGLRGDYVWNLQNGSGHEVAVGIYLWYASPNKGQGKIMVKP
ncbi:MAG: hypothetical protein P1R58_06485 [bacterium]|nr:hypothetical protein [bacterium]